jgi:NAD(P)H-nitrite reductase large subunit
MDFTQILEIGKNLGVISCLIFAVWYLYTERNQERKDRLTKEEKQEAREKELIEKILNSKYETQDYKKVVVKTLQSIGFILQVVDKSVLMQNEKDEEIVSNIEKISTDLSSLIKKLGENERG